jgi:hypothetical protein
MLYVSRAAPPWGGPEIILLCPGGAEIMLCHHGGCRDILLFLINGPLPHTKQSVSIVTRRHCCCVQLHAVSSSERQVHLLTAPQE